jgi:urease subunit alpha
LALESGVAGRAKLDKPFLPIAGTRRLSKSDMLHNDLCPTIGVNSQNFDVFVDGKLATCAPAKELSLAQKYFLR